MNQIFLLILATVAPCLPGRSPVAATYAYSRSTIPGIPEGARPEASSRTALPTSYFIYVVVKKGTPLSVRHAWVKGQCHSATLQKVTSPVLIEHDAAVPTGETDTLVRKTSDDVYRVLLAELVSCNGKDEPPAQLRRQNEVLVLLNAGHVTCYGAARMIRPLRPAAAM